MMRDGRIVFTSFPDRETAVRIASLLVEERLAACVSIVPGAESVYHWEGKICHEEEFLGILKTTAGVFSALSERLKSLHPYEVPEVIAIELTEGSPEYLRWMTDRTGPPVDD